MCSVPLLQLQHRYGDVFSLQKGWKPMVIVNRLKAVQEVLVTHGEDTADRPPVPIFKCLGVKPRSQGERPWGGWRSFQRYGKEQRKHGHQCGWECDTQGKVTEAQDDSPEGMCWPGLAHGQDGPEKRTGESRRQSSSASLVTHRCVCRCDPCILRA